MRGFLDDDHLDGPHEVHISFRPERVAVPIPSGAVDRALAVIEEQCQVWGGATTPLIPLVRDGAVPDAYANALPGSAVDHVLGLDIFALGSPGPLRPDMTVHEQEWWGSQFAPALLEYHLQDSYGILEVVELAPDDPWRPIYAACLGRLPDTPTPDLLTAGYLQPDLTFEDFFRVERVHAEGSLDDLLARLSAEGRITPRQLSMLNLAYGNAGSTALRSKPNVLPSPEFERYDAGPNVIVVCSPGSLDDLALLWNLRGAHGDRRVLPIGLPLDDVTPAAIQTLAAHERIARNGFAHRSAYITSASLDAEAITDRLGTTVEGDNPLIAVGALSAMLDFGRPGGWHRDDVLVWRAGRAQLTPLPPDSHLEIFQRGSMSDLTRVVYDLAVPSSPFPHVADVRVDPFTVTFAAGRRTSSNIGMRSRSQVQHVEWPSTSLIARSIARRRDLELSESEPGRACRVLLSGMKDLGYVSFIAHAPLLDLLEEMAARHGIGWYKARLRALNEVADLVAAVPSTADDLSDRPFAAFKKVLGNNDGAARFWLLWAERAGLMIKGLPLQCLKCLAKQWIPVNAFSPPIICRGCGEPMDQPFGRSTTVNFTYRLSERLRRVYEQDAMGHLLVAHFFDSLLSSGKSGRLIGLHAGMEVRSVDKSAPLGEADVLLLTRRGEFIPVEVKRRATGLTVDEITKLDDLATAMTSPWSAIAACEYSTDAEMDLAQSVVRNEVDGTYMRMALTYDQLLEPRLAWSIGGDPFAFKQLTSGEIAKRERDFVDGLARRSTDEAESMFEYEMLNRHTPPTSPP
ncbi:hypothetical protein N5P18_05025 [Janibacter terrae]|uniref:Uncharacterized protein n=1 Tax=Janibacter terrae TaxID=103817 RepID=A0ABZ2FFZ7_9MICO